MLMWWNKNRTATVLLSKIKEISINASEDHTFLVKGWYNEHNFFSFGEFTTVEDAQQYVEIIRRRVRMAWNHSKTSAVVLSKIKECQIHPTDNGMWKIQGWFNQFNHFNFGTDFASMEECQNFLDDIQTEGLEK